MFDHYPDMNHDGEKNVEDAILFHSLMDATEDESSPPPRSSYKSSAPLYTNDGGKSRINLGNTSYPAKSFCWAVAGFFGSTSFLEMILNGTISLNAFTGLLSLAAIGVGLLAFDYLFG